ncbi:MAG: MATE family efflux transporter [Clostridium sp.]|nr:MATE family efflux transporter [Clostridium sp.]
MNNAISQKFTVSSLLKFALPTTIMMVILSIYTLVDGVFVSNFVGELAFSAINIVFPFISLIFALGIMAATGGNALIANNLGRGDHLKARQDFTLIVLFATLLGIILMGFGVGFTKEISLWLGATKIIEGFSYDYLYYMSFFIPMAIWMGFSQILFVTIGKPNLGLYSTLVGGITNIALDYLFIVVMDLGIKGAALGTGIGYTLPGLFFILYFTFNRKESLYFVKPKWRPAVLLKTFTNGSSEFVVNLATSITTIMFNLIILELAGEEGVAAIGIILYSQFLLMSAFLGYSQGVAPIFSYAFGAQDYSQLKRVFSISIRVILVFSVVIAGFSFLASDYIVGIFVDEQSTVFSLAKNGFTVFSLSFLFMGINIFASSLFTAFSNGRISATISFMRTLVFIAGYLLILPRIFGLPGVWLAIPLAEFTTLFISASYLVIQRKKYNY